MCAGKTVQQLADANQREADARQDFVRVERELAMARHEVSTYICSRISSNLDNKLRTKLFKNLVEEGCENSRMIITGHFQPSLLT